MTRTTMPALTRAGRRPLLAIALGAAALATTFLLEARPASASNTDVYCQGYAQEAVRRYGDYSRKQCGDRVNTVWNPSYATHFTYCKRVDRNTTAWLSNERYRFLLNDCPSKPLPLVKR